MTISFDASEINNWSDKPDASYKLPELIRRLTLATLPEPPSRIDMPSGSSVRMPGWDGLLEVGNGNAWAPQGVSGWEMSCEQGVTNKANKDYETRKAEPLGLDRATSTFVFVTSRRWSAKRQWEQARREEGHWLDVRAIDADDLVAWLEQSPVVTRWFAGTIGTLPFGYEATSRIEERQVETKEMVTSGFGDVQVELAMLRASLGPQAERADSGSELSEAQRKVSDDIDNARNLIQQGLVIAARTQLQRIEKQSGELSDDLRFRLTSHLAICAISEQRTDDACLLLEESQRIQPETPAAIANGALAAQLQDNPKRTMELAQEALELEPQNGSAAASLMWALLKLGEIDRFEDFVSSEEWISQESTPGLTLAGIRAEQSLYQEAISIYDSIIDVDEEDAYAHLGLSHCLLTYAQMDRVPAGFDRESQSRCEMAEVEASRAMELFQPTQLRDRRFDALVLRAGARALLGRVDEAMRDVDAVLSERPEHVAAMIHKGLILLQKGMPEEARVYLEGVQEPEVHDELLLPLAEACLDSGDADTAVELLGGSFQLDPPGWEDVGRVEALLRAEAAMRCRDSVGGPLEAAVMKHPGSPGLLLLSAIHSNLHGDTDSAEASLLRAVDVAREPHRQAIQAQLGNLYASIGRHTDAAEQYARSCGDEMTHPAVIPLLLSLFNSKQYSNALDLAQKIRAENDRIPRVVIEVEAEVRGYVGDVTAALALYRELCCRNDASPDDQVKMVRAQFRCGDREGALKTVIGIDVAKLIEDPNSLMKLAHMKRFLGGTDYLEDAYLAFRHGRSDPETHLGFFGMFLGCGDDEPEPRSVVPGSAVRLRGDDGEQWWQVLEAHEKSLGPRDLSPGEDLTQRLMGASVGDTIVLRDGLEDLSCEVTALQSKHVRAFQEISEEFSTRFPGNMALSRVKFDPQFTKFFEIIDLRHQHVRNVEELYKSGQIPFASFCRLIGLSVLEAWPEYTLDPDARIRFAYGSEEEAIAARAALVDCDIIVLDLMALLTVHRLDIEDGLRKRFARILVPQAVYDEIHEVLYTRRVGATPGAVMGKDESGHYTHTEIDRELWVHRQSQLESLLKLCDSLERVPSYPLLSVKGSEDYIDVLTAAGAGAVFAGGAQDGSRSVLVSDDIVQANMARGLGISTISSQSLMFELLHSECVLERQYSVKIEELAKMNYWFVRVRAADILQSLEVSGYGVTPGTLALLRTLEGPTCSAESAASVAAEVVSTLATSAILRQRLESLLFTILSSVERGRESREVLVRFRHEIGARLRLAPIHSEWVLHVVDVYVVSSR